MRKLLLLIMSVAMLLMTACSSTDNGSTEKSMPTTSLSKPPESDISAVSDTSVNNTSAENFEKTSAVTDSTSAVNSEETSAVTDNNQSSQLSQSSQSSQSSQPAAEKEENDLNITITINEREFSATLYDNETARAFKELLPITLDMSELNGNEKYYYLLDSLPKNSTVPSRINAGDIMLYGGDCIVIFYESFSTSYSYTPIGKIDDPEGLAAALGSGSVQVTFS